MLYVDIPTRDDFEQLNRVRSNACVSIYLKTTPLSQQSDASKTELKNAAGQAIQQLEAASFDKRQLALVREQLDELIEDDDFWQFQANSLAILVTPDSMRTFRLPNALMPMVQVSDRFHLKPLLRVLTYPQSAFVLALAENGAHLVQVHADMPASQVKVPGLPKDAASAVGTASVNSRSASGRVQGSEGQNVRLRQYARRVDEALRPILAGSSTPLILAATGRLASIYPSVCSYPFLADRQIEDSASRLSDGDLADHARPVLDELYVKELNHMRASFDQFAKNGQATTDLSDAARAATYGAISALLVDIDAVVPGTIDEETGVITFADKESATSYGVVDEIAGRAMASGARVLGVRNADMPGNAQLAAILRFPV
jgi:hypothetical protein